MKRYIDKDALVAEIEKLQKTYSKLSTRNNYEDGLKDGRLIGYKDALDKINNLEVKEVDLGLEIILWANAIPEIRYDDVKRIAEYFYEFGLKAKGE